MPLATDEDLAVIAEAVKPSDANIRTAKQAILNQLADGSVRRLTELIEVAGSGSGPERRESIHEEDVADPVRLREHPLIRKRRNYIAAVSAIADLEIAGVISPHQRLDGGGGWDGRFESLRTVSFRRRGGSGSVQLTGLPIPEPQGVAYRLHRAHLGDPEQAHVLDPDLLLEGLELPGRVSRVAREASDAFRRGLPLAAANLLGAVVEGAWMTAARTLAPHAEQIRKALAREPFPMVADVQGRTVDALRHTQAKRADDLATTAALIRDIRNYAIHTDVEHDPDLDGWLQETGVITLFGSVRRHLRLLEDAMAAHLE